MVAIQKSQCYNKLNEYLINNLIKSMEQDKTLLNNYAMFIDNKLSIIYNI